MRAMSMLMHSCCNKLLAAFFLLTASCSTTIDQDRILPSEQAPTMARRTRSRQGSDAGEQERGAAELGRRDGAEPEQPGGEGDDETRSEGVTGGEDSGRGAQALGDEAEEGRAPDGTLGQRPSGNRGDEAAGSDGGDGDGGAPGTCWKVLQGATGRESNHEIPVCCTPTVSEKRKIDRVFELMNEHRVANGLEPLRYDSKLEAAVQGHCRHMAQHTFFSHDAPEWSVGNFSERAKHCGTQAGGENIALGQRTSSEVMQSWKWSWGHNANMLAREHRRVGICYRKGYWGQLFGP